MAAAVLRRRRNALLQVRVVAMATVTMATAAVHPQSHAVVVAMVTTVAILRLALDE